MLLVLLFSIVWLITKYIPFLFIIVLNGYLVLVYIIISLFLEKNSYFQNLGIKFLVPEETKLREEYIIFFYGNPKSALKAILPMFFGVSSVSAAAVVVHNKYFQEKETCTALAKQAAQEHKMLEAKYGALESNPFQIKQIEGEYENVYRNDFTYLIMHDRAVQVIKFVPIAISKIANDEQVPWSVLEKPVIPTPFIEDSQKRISDAFNLKKNFNPEKLEPEKYQIFKGLDLVSKTNDGTISSSQKERNEMASNDTNQSNNSNSGSDTTD